MPNFTIVAIGMWDYCPKIVKIGTFWYKFSPQKIQRVHRKKYRCTLDKLCLDKLLTMHLKGNGLSVPMKPRL